MLVTIVTFATSAPALAQTSCAQFAAEFTPLQQQLGGLMGAPTACPRVDGNGDTIQLTTTGLAVHTPAGMAVFAAGDEHWALTDSGLQQWTANWHAGLYPPATPAAVPLDDQPTTTPADIEPMTLLQVIPDATTTLVVEDASGSTFTVETARGCPAVDSAVGGNVFVRSDGAHRDLILIEQHATCAVAVMQAQGD